MHCFAGILILNAIAHTATVLARPVPQYGPQGIGNYGGYPMGGPMMGNNGPMMGPYGMNGGDQYGPMYNMPGGDGGSRYHNGRMRGQRYHAHAGVDEWPVAKNPYMNARWNRHMSHSEFYANGAGPSGPMMGPSGHNRIPMDGAADESPEKDNDSDDDSDTKSVSGSGDSGSSSAGTDGLRVGGVNRLSSLANSDGISAGADAMDSNTSINIAAMSDRIINVDAFDGASIKSTPSASADKATASSSVGVKTSDKPASTPSGAARQTITRSMNAAKPTGGVQDKNAQKPENASNAQIRLASGQNCAAKRAKSLTNSESCLPSHGASSVSAKAKATAAAATLSSSSHICPSAESAASKKQAAKPTKTSAAAVAADATTTAPATTSACSHQVKVASSKSSQIRAPINTSVPNKKEPSMKNIRGL
ncbi:hypothetical protein H4R99_004012 [Coemansia sp. RSA 1722]|nr:hypothetical protein IWW45_003198 [Coemansia sp. RSA 485]KAJ2598659.1 hypothetical protein H4R99_004012 [Coemansia sp. RSA 1722]